MWIDYILLKVTYQENPPLNYFSQQNIGKRGKQTTIYLLKLSGVPKYFV